MILIGIGVVAFLALRAYQDAARIDPEGTKARVGAIFQAAEMVRVLAAFVTSLFFVLQGRFRPAVLPITVGSRRLSFGSRDNDEDD